MTTVNVLDWARQARPGERLVYHSKQARLDQPIDKDLRETLARAREAHDRGMVFLAQRRVGQCFEYIAQRISPETAHTIKRIGEIYA